MGQKSTLEPEPNPTGPAGPKTFPEPFFRFSTVSAAALQNRRDPVKSRRRDFRMIFGDGSQQILAGIVDPGTNFGKFFGIGGPQKDYGIERISGLKFANVAANLIDLLGFGTRDQIVGAIGLIRGDEIRIERGRQGLHLGH